MAQERTINGVNTISIHGKDYVTVAERIRQLHEQKKEFEIVESEPRQCGDRWVWRVVIRVDGKQFIGNAEAKMANAAKGSPDASNPFECAETSAIGRALAWAGLGTVEGIASYDEMARGMTPTERDSNPQPPQQQRAHAPVTRPQPPVPSQPAKEQRTALILEDKPLDDPMVEARKDVLNAIYNDGKRKGLWGTTAAMAVYMTTALKRPADQPVLPSHLPNLSNDEIALVKSAVEAVKPAIAGAGGGR